ncbi:MAG: class I adenylate-forming enzyme family protein [Eubacterium sp.]|nr:class I adenylate-forming enzyme family protein [Eubacterium sp.]
MTFIEQTIGQVLDQRAKTTPDKDALIVDGGVYTWKDVEAITNYIAKDMKEKGIMEGDHVGIIGKNSDAWLFHYMATVKIGAVAVLFNTRFTQNEIERCIALTNLKHMFYSVSGDGENYEDMLSKMLYPITTVRYCSYMEKTYNEWKNISEENKNLHIISSTDCKAVASILFTSGTTGNSKGVMLTHHNLLNNSKSMQMNMGWTSEDTMGVAVPLFHSFGITGCILAMLHASGKLYLMTSTRSVDLFTAIQTHKITVMNGVPTMFLAMIRNEHKDEFDLTTVKSGIIAGSQIFPQDYIDICNTFKGMKLQPSYGQTETSPCVSMCRLEDPVEIKANTCGRPIEDVQIRIMKKGATEPCGQNVEGEVQIKGYNVMAGYIANPEETKAVFTEDGWLKSGDLGYIREDGYLVITGRYKNLIIRGGENISPVEIEKAIKEVIGQEEVKVFGVPTVVLQEDIVACIEGKEDEERRQKILSHLKTRISDYKIPSHIFFMEEMPRNSTGKINEKALRNKVIAELSVRKRKRK